MKISCELEQGYIDVWNEESKEWDRYIKANKKTVVEENKIPEKLNLDKDELLKNVIITAQDYVIEGKINEIITYLESKGE